MERSFTHIVHPFEPLFNSDSRVLVLGTLPSVKSRESGFYYGHPQNRFWKILAALFDRDVPDSIDKKKLLLLRMKIALWDVVHACDISLSSDNSIRNAEPNDIRRILEATKVERIITNGNAAFMLYKKFFGEKFNVEALRLPSTSPANAMWSLQKLAVEWKNALEPCFNADSCL